MSNASSERVRIFSDRQFNRELFQIAFPMAVQELMLALVAAADAFMLGQLEQDAMSAVSLATQVQFIQSLFFFATVSAVTILASQYWGKGDKKTIGRIFGIGLRVSAVISVVFFVACVFFPRYLMLLFTDEEVLIEIGVRYLRIAGWSYLITGTSRVYMGIMKVAKHPRMTAAVSSTVVILNIVLNAFLIFGLAGCPALGTEGAAWATLIARIVELVWVIILSFIPGYIRPTWKDLFSFNRLLRKDFAHCLLPLMGSNVLWGVGFTVYTACMGHLGNDVTAANAVAAVVRDLVCCFCNGICIGGGILVGNALGHGDLETGKIRGIRLCKLSFLVGGASMILMLASTPLLLVSVKLTPQARETLFGMMMIMAVYMIGRSVNTIIINGVFSAGGDTLFDAYSLAVTMWGMAVPLALLGTFVFDWPPLLVYGMTCLDEVGKIPWVIFHERKYRWVKDLTKEISD